MRLNCIQLICIWQHLQAAQTTAANTNDQAWTERKTEHAEISHRVTNTSQSAVAEGSDSAESLQGSYFATTAKSNHRFVRSDHDVNVENTYPTILNGETALYNHASQTSVPVASNFEPPLKAASEMQQNECKTMLCEKDIGIYFMNTTACSEDIPTIHSTAFTSTIQIMTVPKHMENNTVLCQWVITLPENHYIHLIVAQLAEEFTGNFTMTIRKVGQTGDLATNQEVVDDVRLKNHNFSFVSVASIHARFESHKPHPSQVVTIQFEINEGSYIHDYEDDDNECRNGDEIAVGTKCYTLVILERGLTWFDAQQNCTNRGLRLATFKTPEEFEQFRELMPAEVHAQDTYVGAHLTQGLQAVSIVALYRNIWRWVDGTSDFSVQIFDRFKNLGSCSMYFPQSALLNACSCRAMKKAFVCESYQKGQNPYYTTVADTNRSVFIDPSSVAWKVSVVECPSYHMTRNFLSCDARTDCDAPDSSLSCNAGGVTVPNFVCQRSRATVHFTFVCDYKQHCSDNSDEDFCKFPDCSSTSLKCRNGQCFSSDQWCDGKLDCGDGSEEECRTDPLVHHDMILLPGILNLDGKGNFELTKMNSSDECPPTHFSCPRSFCLPVYILCNGIDDCPNREDEVGCDSYQCHGFYRCLGSKVCMHADNVCDGIPQCPEQDDELLCDLSSCPTECRCQGLAFVCRSIFSAIPYIALRYLDASGSTMTLSDVSNNTYLITLRLKKCHIISLPTNMTFPNLRELDLSWNELDRLDMRNFYTLKNLRILLLTGNPLIQITHSETSESVTMALESVDLSYTNLEVFGGSPLVRCPHIKTINISWSRLRTISEDGFRVTPQLEDLDLTGCHLMNFPRDILRELLDLKTVYVENYKLCCEAMLPVHFDPKNCHSPLDLLASCKDLLKSNSYRIFLWIFASLSLVGNVFSVGVRLVVQKEGGALTSFVVFVTNLCVADFFMGLYLTIIGTADVILRGRYLWRDEEWKSSTACNTAGFLCLLSSEASAFIICLITLDRFLVLRFPFSRLHFDSHSALIACGTAWVVGISLAMVPLLPITSHWEFYSQTGICIPLPFSNKETFSGYNYSFSVSILLNFFLFLLIAVGQAVIYWAVRANSMPSSTNTRERDVAVARRLLTIVVSDFLCWFPIGLLGLLASTGTAIPGDLNVAVATFILPINSALNPFLYTFNVVLEKRKKAQNEKLLKRLELENRIKYQQQKKQHRPAMKPNHSHSTSGLSSSSTNLKTRSSASQSHLPSVSLSYSGPRPGNAHNNYHHHHQQQLNHHNNKNNHSRVSSPLKSSWKQEPKLEPLSRQNTDASAVTLSSVHWSSDGDGGKKADDGGSRRRSRKTPDPAQVWARYVRTTAADRLYGSGSGSTSGSGSSRAGRVHFHEGGGEGGGGGKDDGKFSKKISLPCPSNAACCFCVYSRQLGPVRVYMSSVRPSESRAARLLRRKSDPAAKGEEIPPSEDKPNQRPKVVFLKERWLRCSAPTGEVIVPEIPEPEVHKPSYHDRCLLSSTNLAYANGDVHWTHNHRGLAHGMSVPARSGASTSMRKLDSFLGLGSSASHFVHHDATIKTNRSTRSVSFQDDVDLVKIPARWAADSCVGQNGSGSYMSDVLSRSRGAASRSAPAMYVAAGSPGRKGCGKSAGKIAMYDYMKCPEPFSRPREFPLPVRLVPARQGK